MSKNTLYTGIAVTVTLLVVGIFFIIGVPFDTSSLTQGAAVTTATSASTQLVMQDVVQGSGRAAQAGDKITVNYTGKLEDGTVFDTSLGKTPYSFVLGAGEVITGWDQGLVGAQAGAKRLLIIPPGLAYGPQDYGPIPGNSTLMFEVDVLKVEPAGQ